VFGSRSLFFRFVEKIVYFITSLKVIFYEKVRNKSKSGALGVPSSRTRVLKDFFPRAMNYTFSEYIVLLQKILKYTETEKKVSPPFLFLLLFNLDCSNLAPRTSILSTIFSCEKIHFVFQNGGWDPNFKKQSFKFKYLKN